MSGERVGGVKQRVGEASREWAGRASGQVGSNSEWVSWASSERAGQAGEQVGEGPVSGGICPAQIFCSKFSLPAHMNRCEPAEFHLCM